MPQQNQYNPVNTRTMVGEMLTGNALHKLLMADMTAIDNLLAMAERIKVDKIREVLIATLPTGEKILCKVHKEIGVIARLRCWLFASKAARGHKKNKQLIQLGFEGPNSIGYLLRNRFGRDCDSIHFTEFFAGAETVESRLMGNKVNNEELLSELATLLSRLHTQGYVHGDTKLSNFLIANEKLQLIDLDGFTVFTKKWTPARDIARVLVGLSEVSLSRAVMDEFLRAYCGASSLAPDAFKKELILLIPRFQQKHQQKYGITPIDIF